MVPRPISRVVALLDNGGVTSAFTAFAERISKRTKTGQRAENVCPRGRRSAWAGPAWRVAAPRGSTRSVRPAGSARVKRTRNRLETCRHISLSAPAARTPMWRGGPLPLPAGPARRCAPLPRPSALHWIQRPSPACSKAPSAPSRQVPHHHSSGSKQPPPAAMQK